VSEHFEVDIAALAQTPEQLALLYRERPKYWELAGLGSELVQRRTKLQPTVDAHLQGLGSASGRRIENHGELLVLYHEVLTTVLRLQEELQRSMVAPAFRRLFGDQDLYDGESTPEDVTAAATFIIDFYRGLLMLARQTRGVEARPDYGDVIDNMAHLVDAPLDGVDQFIAQTLGFIAVMPSLGWRDSDATSFHTLVLKIDSDDALLNRIGRQLKILRQPWRRWFS
jgi:hypothetical protein